MFWLSVTIRTHALIFRERKKISFIIFVMCISPFARNFYSVIPDRTWGWWCPPPPNRLFPDCNKALQQRRMESLGCPESNYNRFC